MHRILGTVCAYHVWNLLLVTFGLEATLVLITCNLYILPYTWNVHMILGILYTYNSYNLLLLTFVLEITLILNTFLYFLDKNIIFELHRLCMYMIYWRKQVKTHYKGVNFNNLMTCA